MLAILRRCQDDSGIRRRLGGLKVANDGALDALRSDVGVVYAKGGRIAMAITVEGIPTVDYTPDNPGSILIADLAKILVEGGLQPARGCTPHSPTTDCLRKRCFRPPCRAIRMRGSMWTRRSPLPTTPR